MTQSQSGRSALMVGAMTIHGIVPGPQVMEKQPELFWGMTASIWLGNLMLVVINLPLVSLWVSLLRVPHRLLYPSIIVVCCIGVYSIISSPADVIIAAGFGLFGYWLVKHDFEPAPLVLAFVLGPLMEENLHRAMLISRGDATVFITRPISAELMAVVFVLLAIAVLQSADWLRRVEPGDTDARWPIRNPIRCLNVTTGVGRTAPLDDQE